MDVIFEGRLSESAGMLDVLRTLPRYSRHPNCLLRIADQRSGWSGKITILDGSYVVAAVAQAAGSDELISGYTALRQLLETKEGNFAYLDLGPAAPGELDVSMHIAVQQLARNIYQLPDHPTQLFDEKSLLDRVFGDEDDPDDRFRRQSPVVPSNFDQPEKQQPLASQAFQSIIRPAHDSFNFDYALERDSNQAGKLGNLRSEQVPRPWLHQLLRDSFFSKTGLVWVVVTLIVIAAAILFATTALNGRTWLTIQKNSIHGSEPSE